MNYLKNQKLNRFIRRAEKLCKPEKVVLIDGSKELYDSLLKQAVSTGEMIPLNEQKLPNCFLHRLRSQRRRPRRGQDVYLLRQTRGRRSHQQLDGARQGVFSA